MPRDPSGNYTLPLGAVIPNTPIATTWANPSLNDIATALTGSLSRAGEGGMTGPFKAAAGSLGAPGIAWSVESSTGFFRNGAGDMQAVVAGVVKMRWNTGVPALWDGAAWSNITTLLTGDARYARLSGSTLTGITLIPDGTKAGPAIGFAADSNVGIYKATATDGLGLACNVVEQGSSATDTAVDYRFLDGSGNIVWTFRRRSTANSNVFELFRTVGGISQSNSMSFGYPADGVPGTAQFPAAPTVGGVALALSVSPTFTGTVVLPTTTSIGPVDSTEIGYLNGVTSNIQTQLTNLGNLQAGSGVVRGTTVTPPSAGVQGALTAFANSTQNGGCFTTSTAGGSLTVVTTGTYEISVTTKIFSSVSQYVQIALGVDGVPDAYLALEHNITTGQSRSMSGTTQMSLTAGQVLTIQCFYLSASITPLAAVLCARRIS